MTKKLKNYIFLTLLLSASGSFVYADQALTDVGYLDPLNDAGEIAIEGNDLLGTKARAERTGQAITNAFNSIPPIDSW